MVSETERYSCTWNHLVGRIGYICMRTRVSEVNETTRLGIEGIFQFYI
jgi:hypothetical protein